MAAAAGATLDLQHALSVATAAADAAGHMISEAFSKPKSVQHKGKVSSMACSQWAMVLAIHCIKWVTRLDPRMAKLPVHAHCTACRSTWSLRPTKPARSSYLDSCVKHSRIMPSLVRMPSCDASRWVMASHRTSITRAVLTAGEEGSADQGFTSELTDTPTWLVDPMVRAQASVHIDNPGLLSQTHETGAQCHVVAQVDVCHAAGRHHQLCAPAAVRLRQHRAGCQQPGAPTAGAARTVLHATSFSTVAQKFAALMEAAGVTSKPAY